MKPRVPEQRSLFDLPAAPATPEASIPKLADAEGWAEFDDDEKPKHRLRVGRRWGEGPTALFVGLNPSKAGAKQPDATLAKILGFTHRLTDCRAFEVGNLYSYIATDTSDMEAAAKRGEVILDARNDERLAAMAREASMAFLVVSGHRLVSPRITPVVEILAAAGLETYCLGLTKEGFPLHPSRLPYDKGSVRPFTREDLTRLVHDKGSAR